MRLVLERVSTRNTANEYGVVDELTGKSVGTVSFERVPRGNRNYPTRTIRLFDSKYVGSFNTHSECVAFVKGIETVLNYVLGAKEFETVTARLTSAL
jgi:hypothetical protein